MSKKLVMQNSLLLLIIAAIIIVPYFYLTRNTESEFAGADTIATELVAEEYTPWIEPLFAPASGEIESLLFALQASIGTAIVTFTIGYYKGKSVAKKAESGKV